MPANDDAPPFYQRPAFFVALVVAGIICVALSIVWPTVSNGRSQWSGDQAAAYQSAAANLHQLSMRNASMPADKQTRAIQNELADAQTEYARLRSQLDAAREGPTRTARLMRFAGLAVAFIGLVGLIANRS